MSYLLFLLLGLGSGAIYAMLALGLVLKYRSAGVIDFSHCAVAMFCAYVYLEIHEAGQLILPWTAIPWHIQLFSTHGTSTVVAIVITLAYAAVLGLIFYYAVVRPLRHAPALARVGASVGLMLYLQGIAVLNFGSFSLSSPPILPQVPVHLANGLIIPSDRLYLTGIVILIGLGSAPPTGCWRRSWQQWPES
jgi:branched-subunit amino acid ABC-type transport system permease component